MSDSVEPTGERTPAEITRLLADWKAGSDAAGDLLSTLVYQRLREIAGGQMQHELHQVTLQPTAVVHEVVMQLLDRPPACESRDHLFALAARMMRNFLINHAKQRMAQKRGGQAVRVTLDESSVAGSDPNVDLLALEAAMEALGKRDPAKLDMLELHYFGGLGYDELVRVTGRSRASVHRDLRMARAFVASRLGVGDASA
ncbi:RNA polymerase subunit sigma-70 [Wenzhouxiangella sp. XN79A]|uniref:ECF-type sigma factor n=1 Tax=Wenzhouxiangella sp. XN79A TaxID=2724193 RepID=UPI00144AF815|nr:ECF-type sigma factor [Wenzhouxiangella sp. XN79A]NKI35780.1 RNA polymerase subunit sigma-70 [Wenzhouxiangella sp. XN79A]